VVAILPRAAAADERLMQSVRAAASGENALSNASYAQVSTVW
jgi:hypothetical protein